MCPYWRGMHISVAPVFALSGFNVSVFVTHIVLSCFFPMFQSGGIPTPLIWFHPPGCGSSEQCISSCTSCPSSPLHSCLVNEAAGVTCSK